MPGQYFGALLKDTKIHKKGTELFLKLVESIEIGYNKYLDAIKAWRSQDYDTGYSIRDEIIQLEKEADQVKDAWLQHCRKAYLPNIREERYNLIINADRLLGRIERAVRILCLKKIDISYFPSEFDEILEKTGEVLLLFINANRVFFGDLEEAARIANEVERIRDEVRDLYYSVLEQAVNDKLPRGTARLLNASTRITIEAEEGMDYLKVLIAKHS